MVKVVSYSYTGKNLLSQFHTVFTIKLATSADFSKAQKICAFTAGYFECLLLGGVVYGWANLVYVLKSEGVFHDHCLNTTREFSEGNGTEDGSSCEAQDNLYDLAFTVASFSKGAAALLVGLLLDYAGLRVTRLIATCSLTVGGFLIGYCSKERPYYLFPGSLLIGLGGAEIRIANFQIANMFPKNKATVMSLYNGAFCGSGAVFLALKWCYGYGIKRSIFLYVWTGISGLTLLPTLLLLPKSIIKAIDEAEIVQNKNNSPYRVGGSTDQLVPSFESDEESSTEEYPEESALNSFRSISYVLHLFCGGTLALGLMLYMGIFNWWANSIAADKDQVSQLSEIYGLCQIPMIAIGPLVGILMDSAVKRALNEEDLVSKRKKLQRAGFVALILETLIVSLLSACRLFPNILSVYISLALYTFARPVLNSVNPGYLRIRFPQAHFNKLMGAFGTGVCIYCVLQFPFFIWIQNDPFLANSVMVGILVLTFVNPFHLLCLRSN